MTLPSGVRRLFAGRDTVDHPAWGEILSEETTDAILAYVIKRANDEKAEQEAAVAAAKKP